MRSKTDGKINTEQEYQKALAGFDAASCEAIAVSQANSGRLELPTVGLGTHLFVRLCVHAVSIMNAAPKSRWTSRNFDLWDVSTIASHSRSIMEGYLLFYYLFDANEDEDTQRAYMFAMHMYDCKKRISILPHVLSNNEIEGLKKQALEIEETLVQTNFFKNLTERNQKDILAGKYLMISPKTEIIAKIGIDQAEFDFFWNYLSQYTHVLSFSFYRMESVGRGTGLENEFDREALKIVLNFCTSLLSKATDLMVKKFPDVKNVRKGVNSKFSPGPSSNQP